MEIASELGIILLKIEFIVKMVQKDIRKVIGNIVILGST